MTTPQIGAQVWIERDTTRAELDHWMKLLHGARMPVARIFIHTSDPSTPGGWRFKVYDDAFDAAAQYGVGIVATLTPPFPVRTAEQLEESQNHVATVVERYRTHPALDTWLLVNEPSVGIGDYPIAFDGFIAWLTEKYGDVGRLNDSWEQTYKSFDDIVYHPGLFQAGGWVLSAFVDSNTYWREHHIWQLNAIGDVVRRLDDSHPLHVNPHGLLGNIAGSCYDLPAWRSCVDILGASLHPAWHFGLLQRRDQYALGVSYVCDLIRGASEPAPFWVTELQGGNNIYSGTAPLYPRDRDISQWTWLSVFSGAQTTVYWLLNARSKGVEAGEWSLLDLQSQPSERYDTAAKITTVINDNSAIFESAEPLKAPITLIVSLESMTLQSRFGDEDGQGHVMELLGFYEVFQELGVPVNIKHFDDFDWTTARDIPATVILPHVSAISAEQAAAVTEFVKLGNNMLATGLTGFYDPMSTVWSMKRFPLQEAFGGQYKEVRYLNKSHNLKLTDPDTTLPVYKLCGDIDNSHGCVTAIEGERIVATTTRFGLGATRWLPSLIGTAAWHGDRQPLKSYVADICADIIAALPISIAEQSGGVTLRTMTTDSGYLTFVTNGTDQPATCRLALADSMNSAVLWQSSGTELDVDTVSLAGRGSIVVAWTN